MINLVFRRPNDAPSERPTPVAPVHNKSLTFRTTMRNILFSPSAGSTDGRTRDFFSLPNRIAIRPAILTLGCVIWPGQA